MTSGACNSINPRRLIIMIVIDMMSSGVMIAITAGGL